MPHAVLVNGALKVRPTSLIGIYLSQSNSIRGLGIEIFAVPNGRIEVFSQGKTVKDDDGHDGFEHKEKYDPKFGSAALL